MKSALASISPESEVGELLKLCCETSVMRNLETLDVIV